MDIRVKKDLFKALCYDFLAIVFMQVAQKYELANWIFCYTCISMLKDLSRIINVLIYGDDDDEIPYTKNVDNQNHEKVQ